MNDEGQDLDRNVLVTVKISQGDYNDMVEHFEKDKGGRPVVAVNSYFDVDDGDARCSDEASHASAT